MKVYYETIAVRSSIDKAGIDGAIVIVHDMSGKYRKRPWVTIRYTDGREKTIDVFATVYRNAASIAHPLVIHAIRRWEGIVRFHHALSREPKGTKKQSTRNARRAQREDYYRIAKGHIEELGKALIDGVLARSLPIEDAVALDAKSGFLRPNGFHLNQVWQIMAKPAFRVKPHGDGLDTPRSEADKLRYIRREMELIWKEADVAPSEKGINEIIEFLSSDIGQPFLRRRGRAAAFENAFYAWRFNYPLRTASEYRSRAKKNKQIKGDARFHLPDVAKSFAFGEIGDWFSLPDVEVVSS